MKIAIDLDNTINANKESIEFFSVMTNLLISKIRIAILTNREPNTEQDIAVELDFLGIQYSEIVITPDKAGYIRKNKIIIFFENTDESFQELTLDETLVFKIRESGNWEDGRWIGSNKTTKMID